MIEKFKKLKEEFDKDTDELLNQICDTFHDELKVIANKYGAIKVSLDIIEYER